MLSWKRAAAFAATLGLALAIATSAEAGKKKFTSDDDSKKDGESTDYLKNYDKLMEGDEADWVYVADAAALKGAKSVKVEEFTTNRKGEHKSEARDAADDGKRYMEQWVEDSKKLGWDVAKGGADLTIKGNVFDAWEPNGAARYWGGWAANPGVGLEVQGIDKSGKVVFEIRHKSKGSSIQDAVENGLEDVVKELAKAK